MNPIKTPPGPEAHTFAVPASGQAGSPAGPGESQEFAQVMAGFAAAAPADSGPSLVSQLVRVPTKAYTEGLADLEKPPPQGMSVADSIRFYTQKQNELGELKILQNMSLTVIRMVRKQVETVLNSK